MEWSHITELTKALAWPVTTILLVIFLRNHIRDVLSRVQGAKLPGGAELSFGKAAVDQANNTQPAWRSSPAHASESLVAHVYWLGYDLMWTIDATLRGAPAAIVIRGLEKALIHMESVCVAGDPGYVRLVSALSAARLRPDSHWTVDLRNRLANELNALANSMRVVGDAPHTDTSRLSFADRDSSAETAVVRTQIASVRPKTHDITGLPPISTQAKPPTNEA